MKYEAPGVSISFILFDVFPVIGFQTIHRKVQSAVPQLKLDSKDKQVQFIKQAC